MIKSVIMPGNKQAIVVYRLPDGRVYCSDASSTAFEFPLSNAKVITDGAWSRHGCQLLLVRQGRLIFLSHQPGVHAV